jgi:hypothetical protein
MSCTRLKGNPSNPPMIAVDPSASDFFYPLLFLVPGFEGEAVEHSPFRLCSPEVGIVHFRQAVLSGSEMRHCKT